MRGSVRIIGGRWRGSKLPVADLPGLRPSSDRVRETLFNWLQSGIAGARCLDLFAGSGALGLEAASRGAASVVLVEREHALALALRASVARLDGAAAKVEVLETDALSWLAQPRSQRFELVFLDPPFASLLWGPVFAALPGWLAPAAWIYLESPLDTPATPDDWVLYREGRTREVRYALYRSGVAVPTARMDSAPG